MEILIVNHTAREKRYALLVNKKVEKLVIARPQQQSLVGSIFCGIVTKVLPGMNAVFVEIGEGKNAYLQRQLLASYVASDEDKKAKEQKSISSFVHQGEKLLIQIEKDAAGTKGPKATGIIEIPGEHLIYLPKGRYMAISKKITEESKKVFLRQAAAEMKSEDEGIIFRTSSMGLTEKKLRDELEALRCSYKQLQQKAGTLNRPGLLYQKDSFVESVIDSINKMAAGEVVVDDLQLKQKLAECENVKNGTVQLRFYQQTENIFSAYRIEHEIDKALKRIVWLDNGAYLIFDEAEALTLIDVNTGKFSGKNNLEETILKTNQLAAREIARQLRLRDLGGMILIDFIDMKREEDRQAILRVMKDELHKDEKRTKLVGFTPLGILQLTRKKTRVSLSEALQEKCPACEGTGRLLSAETQAFRLERELFEHRHSDYEAVIVETTKEVKEAFAGPEQMYQVEFEASAGLKIYFQITPSVSPYYVIKQFGSESELSGKVM